MRANWNNAVITWNAMPVKNGQNAPRKPAL